MLAGKTFEFDGKKLSSLFFQLASERVRSQTVPTILYHYTTPSGLKGIVEEKKIWATSIYHLNDATEFKYGCDVLSELLTDIERESTSESSAVKAAFIRALRKRFESPGLILSNVLYVTCFCQDPDVLSQWQSYGSPEGYAIGFRTGPRPFVRAPRNFGAQLLKVDYIEDSQRRSLRRLIDAALTSISDLPRGVPEDGVDCVTDPFVLWIFLTLVWEIASFKHPLFHREEEWRVLTQPSVLRPDLQPQIQPELRFQFRATQIGLAPYIELSLEKSERWPIAKVTCGPSASPEPRKEAVRWLLRLNGFDDPDVEESAARLRW